MIHKFNALLRQVLGLGKQCNNISLDVLTITSKLVNFMVRSQLLKRLSFFAYIVMILKTDSAKDSEIMGEVENA